MKRFIALILAILMIVTFTACSENERIKFVRTGEVYEYEGRFVRVVYDPVTKIEYFMSGYLMCPRYDKNGELMFYKGE